MLLLQLAATLALSSVNLDDPISHVPGVKLTGAEDELFAWHVGAAGDVNRDGFADVLVYATKDNSGYLDGVVRVHSGHDGVLLYTFSGFGNLVHIGNPMAGAGDVDGDGHADVIVGSSYESRATIYSGRNGGELFTFHGDVAVDDFGGSVAAAGDVNGDGHPDVMVGTIGYHPVASFYVRVFSGADGTPLFTFHQEDGWDLFGVALAGVGDVDGDGHADLAVGAPNDGLDLPFLEDFSGTVTLFSGGDGSVLWTKYGIAPYAHFGQSLSSIGDVDADGLDDVLVGAWGATGRIDGDARILSGADGSLLNTVSSDGAEQFLAVSGAGDLDADGIPDALVTNLWVFPPSKVTRAFSGKDGSDLFQYEPLSNDFPQSAAGLGDVNGDGLDDFVVGVVELNFGGGFAQLFVSQGAPAHATPYGCGGNPPGSLAVSGTPAPGGTLTLSLDDPSGSMALPATAFLLVSSQPDSSFPCGTSKPGWGLASPGSTGELLVSVAPPDPIVTAVGMYTGSSLEVRLTIPGLAGLVGKTVYVQGALMDRWHRIGLTDAVEVSIGVPQP